MYAQLFLMGGVRIFQFCKAKVIIIAYYFYFFVSRPGLYMIEYIKNIWLIIHIFSRTKKQIIQKQIIFQMLIAFFQEGGMFMNVM